MRSSRGFSVLVLTNAMQPMLRPRIRDGLTALRDAHGDRLTLRVSLDHYSRRAARHRARPQGSFAKTVEGIDWLAREGFKLALAGRTCWGESEADARGGYAALIAARAWPVDAYDHGASSSCSPRWTSAPTCRKSPKAAGASWAKTRTR